MEQKVITLSRRLPDAERLAVAVGAAAPALAPIRLPAEAADFLRICMPAAGADFLRIWMPAAAADFFRICNAKRY